MWEDEDEDEYLDEYFDEDEDEAVLILDDDTFGIEPDGEDELGDD